MRGVPRPCPFLTQARLKKICSYDPITGLFVWFPELERKQRRTYQHNRGYLQVFIDGRLYLLHRLAWLYVHGAMPVIGLDHENERKHDNRLANLRPATQSQNLQNTGRRKSNTSGFKGVSWQKCAKKWAAYITVNYRRTHLGLFPTPELAHQAYCAAATKHHGAFARFN